MRFADARSIFPEPESAVKSSPVRNRTDQASSFCVKSQENTITLSRTLLLLACVIAPGGCFAQGQVETSSPPIEILKLKWKEQVRIPRNFDPSMVSANGAFGDPRNPLNPTAGATPSAVDATRADTKARNDAAGTDSVFPAVPNRLPVFYLYSMTVRNTGAKTIEGVAWDYFFFDASGSRPLGSHQFLSYHRLAPGKTITFQRPMRSPPVRVVDASAQKNAATKFAERAVIECVLYSDATIWRGPVAREGICDLLKSSKTGISR